MLRSVNEITNFVLKARDGEIGRCKDFLFDDEQWVVRYMVADTGKWLPGRKVLVSPISLGEPEWDSKRLPVNLNKETIERAPGIEEDAPVSRQYESKWFSYYRYPYYWSGGGIWGGGIHPGALASEKKELAQAVEEEGSGDSHLRSAGEITGYHIQAKDGEIGHVEDFVLDDETWVIRYMVVDTRNWLPGRKVLIAPAWVESFDWAKQKAEVDLTRQAVRNSPEYDPADFVRREYEEHLHDYYNRPRYWQRA
jgi:hypothetical protein